MVRNYLQIAWTIYEIFRTFATKSFVANLMYSKRAIYPQNTAIKLFYNFGLGELHRQTIRIVCLLVLIVSFQSNTHAQGSDSTQRLDSLFSTLFNNQLLSGNVLVADRNQVVYKKSFGYADIQQQIPNTDSSVFTIASISKTITSVAVLQLMEKRKLKLDDLLIKYLSSFPFPNMTVRHLLSHSSGLPDKEVLFDSLLKSQPKKVIVNQDIIPALKSFKKPLAIQPGEKWQYSNINYNLLALLVEKLTHIPFEVYLGRYIFKPAHMTHTSLQTALHKQVVKNRTVNYMYSSHYSPKLAKVDTLASNKMWYNLSGLIGQGGIVTTTQDLFNFDQALYNGTLLKSSTLNEAFTPTKLTSGQPVDIGGPAGRSSYGLGWFILADTSAGKIVWHNGSVPGGLGIFLRNITHHRTVIVLDNAESFGIYTAGVNAMNILNKKPLVLRKRSVAEIYAKALLAKGTDYSVSRLNVLRSDSSKYYLEPGEMDQIGYELLNANHIEHALEVFRLNTLLKPDAWQVYQSYGTALEKAGKQNEAISMYEQSLRLNPKNESAKKALSAIKVK